MVFEHFWGMVAVVGSGVGVGADVCRMSPSSRMPCGDTHRGYKYTGQLRRRAHSPESRQGRCPERSGLCDSLDTPSLRRPLPLSSVADSRPLTYRSHRSIHPSHAHSSCPSAPRPPSRLLSRISVNKLAIDPLRLNKACAIEFIARLSIQQRRECPRR